MLRLRHVCFALFFIRHPSQFNATSASELRNASCRHPIAKLRPLRHKPTPPLPHRPHEAIPHTHVNLASSVARYVRRPAPRRPVLHLSTAAVPPPRNTTTRTNSRSSLVLVGKPIFSRNVRWEGAEVCRTLDPVRCRNRTPKQSRNLRVVSRQAKPPWGAPARKTARALGPITSRIGGRDLFSTLARNLATILGMGACQTTSCDACHLSHRQWVSILTTTISQSRLE